MGPPKPNAPGWAGGGGVGPSSGGGPAPTGRLMEKINRHETRVSIPPTTGPADDATEAPIAHTATARARLPGCGYAWPISAIDDGITTAAAAPCTNRDATSTFKPGARQIG